MRLAEGSDGTQFVEAAEGVAASSIGWGARNRERNQGAATGERRRGGWCGFEPLPAPLAVERLSRSQPSTARAASRRFDC